MNLQTRLKETFLTKTSDKPFSFIYHGKKSADLLPAWNVQIESHKTSETKTTHVLTYQDPQTNLHLTCEITEYTDFPALEWVLHFKNTGLADTPILENILPLDTALTRQQDREFVLHRILGSLYDVCEYAPSRLDLMHHTHRRLACVGGRSSNGADETRMDGTFPFFDLEFDDGGITLGIGWTGQWAAELRRDDKKSLTLSAGMEQTHLKLLPGESIRTPKILLFAWTGRPDDGRNHLRRFLLKYHTPLKDGKPVTFPFCANTWFQHNFGGGVTEENQIEAIRENVRAGTELDCYWLDAGWFDGEGNWAFNVGNWFPNKKRFPRGLKPVVDEAQKHGMGFVLWFEPERVQPGTWLWQNHPEWLILPNDEIKRQRGKFIPNVDALLNLGCLDARQWLTDHVDALIRENGVTIYRQDMNFDPLIYWRSADTPDRQGITEIRHIEGLYAFWDELRRRNPGLVIDNVASGSRRLDFETISRSITLWRSDFAFDPEAAQCQTLGLGRYLLWNGTGINSADPYIFRSNLAAGLVLSWGDPNLAPPHDDALRTRIQEYKLLRPLFFGDFYPLTSHSTASDTWCAYQLDRNDLNLGAVLAFRRKESPFSNGRFKLQGLVPRVVYEITDYDTKTSTTLTGEELMNKGLPVMISDCPGSALFMYTARTT